MTPAPRFVLAGIVPVVLCALVVRTLSAEVATEPGPVAKAIEARLHNTKADVVMVGASFADADFDRTVLGKALSPSGQAAITVTVPAATAPVWYALLKERVYGNGLAPKLVILPVSTPTALVTKLLPAQAERLTDQMPVYDDVVMRRSFGSAVPATLQRVLDRRGSLRDPVLAAFRNALPGLILGFDGPAVSAAGTAVFGEQHDGPGARLLPVVEQASATRDAASVSVTDPAESYLADIAALVTAHGGRLAIVLPPTSPAATVPRRLAPAVEADLVAWANEQRVGWLDLRELAWDASKFKDPMHMRTASAREFSTLVATRLKEMGAFSEAGFEPASPPVVATAVRRTGTPPALPALTMKPGKEPCAVTITAPGLEVLGTKHTLRVAAGIGSPLDVFEGDDRLTAGPNTPGCSGTWRHVGPLVVRRKVADGPPLRVEWSTALPDGPGKEHFAWVLPGTALEWTFTERPGAAAQVEAEVLAFGDGAGAPQLQVADVALPFAPAGLRLRAQAPAPTTSGAWVLRVESPADGPFLLVRRLRIEGGGVSTPIIEDIAAAGRDVLDGNTWTVEGPVPTTPTYPLKQDGPLRWFEVPRVNTCSPFQVNAKGTLIPRDTNPNTGTSQPIAGATVQAGPRLYLPSSLTADDVGDGAGFVVQLAEDRHCAGHRPKGADGFVWLYGDNTIHVEVPRAKRHALNGDMHRLLVSGTQLLVPHVDLPLHVRVHLGDELLAEVDLPTAGLEDGLPVVLPRPIPAMAEGTLTVDATWPAPGPPLLLRVQIADSGA